MTDKLLLKYLKGIASPDESEEIENWILASKENTDYFEKVKLDFVVNTFDETIGETSTDQTYFNFRNKYINKKPIYQRLSPAFKYAAVTILLITSSYFIFFNRDNTPDIALPNNAITLELENGDVRIIKENGEAEVYDIHGKVVGKQHGQSLKYLDTDSKKELVYNTLTVPYGKTFELQLSDGTKAHLNAGSSLRYPVQFLAGGDRQVFVTGEVYLEVAKDSLHPFLVNANKLNVRVLGTQFNVYAYPEDSFSEIVLVEGSVGLYTDIEDYDTQKITMLSPGYKASFDRNNNDITKEAVITDIYTSWMNGELVFREMSFENILKKMERHYNVTIINKNKELSKEKFNASLGKNPPIENVLEDLKTTYNIGFTIDGNTVTIE